MSTPIKLWLKERMLYGSSLLGIRYDSIPIGFCKHIEYNPDIYLTIAFMPVFGLPAPEVTPTQGTTIAQPMLPALDEHEPWMDTNYLADVHRYSDYTGKIQYGLTNHLGNVLATISDKPLPA